MRLKGLDSQWLLPTYFIGVYKVVDPKGNILDPSDYTVPERRYVMINPNNEKDILPDRVIDTYIETAIAEVQALISAQIGLKEHIVEFHDYDQDAALEFFMVKTYKYPIIKVHEMKITYGENGADILVFPENYLQIKSGTNYSYIQVLPRIGGGLYLSASPQLSYYFQTAGSLSGRIPSAIRLEYDAGLEGLPDELDMMLVDAIGMIAAMRLFSMWGNIIIAPGVASFSTSFDGISVSIGTTASAENSPFSATILELDRKLHGRSIEGTPGTIAMLKKKYQRISVGIL